MPPGHHKFLRGGGGEKGRASANEKIIRIRCGIRKRESERGGGTVMRENETKTTGSRGETRTHACTRGGAVDCPFRIPRVVRT